MSDIPWNEIGLRCEPADVEPLVSALPTNEVVGRLKKFAAWVAEFGTGRGVHVVMTPVLAEFLARESGPLEELDGLVGQTRNGRFDPDNPVQRDLEFGRFLIEYRRFSSSRPADEDAYALFTELDRLPLSRELEWEPSVEDMLSVKRAAHEAVGLARFLDEFRKRTARPIIVLGNDKGQLLGGGYGRLWVVEPLEEHLQGKFEIRYDRVTSHGTMRLNVPSPFSKSFIQRICEEMPHFVIVDGAGPSRVEGATRFSRVARGYANWFAIFNDLRRGDAPSAKAAELLPPNHLAELSSWHEYRIVREEIARWTTPGDEYGSALWSPEPGDSALLGEIVVPWSSPSAGDRPQVVHANPIIYRSNRDAGGRQVKPANGLPDYIARTNPYYLDSVDKRLRLASFIDGEPRLTTWGEVNNNPEGPVGCLNPTHTVFGFGPHGFERRAVGPSLARCVDVLQNHIRTEIDDFLATTAAPSSHPGMS